MGSTSIEKILARTSGKDRVRPGELAVCVPDMILHLDLTMTTEGAWHKPKKVFDPERIAVIMDHAVPAPTIKDAAGIQEGRRFAKQFGLRLVDVGRHGIGHVIAAEQGLARPGELLVCADSHTVAAGAFNTAARGIGPADQMQAITKGLVWFPVTPTIRYEFTGELPAHASGKDVFLQIAQEHGGHSALSIEYGGPGLASLPMHERRTIATMSTELSADFAVFDFDAVTEAWLKGRGEKPLTPVFPDKDAEYQAVRTLDLSKVEPYIARPGGVLKNNQPMSSFGERRHVDQAFVGSCANGQIEDLRIVARIVKGRKVAEGTRFIVTPGSQAIYLQAVREGLVETMLEAGVLVTNSTCGACLGYHMGVLAPGEVCITASTRNFKGRMGSVDAEIYMASPATVAASAIAGVITDARALQ